MKSIKISKSCVICGFNKKVEQHHLCKYMDYGSDDEKNLVYLCPNHHWIADFGDEKDRELLLRKVKEITGKEPLIDGNKKDYYEKLVRAYIENQFGKLTDEEYMEKFYNSNNRIIILKIFNSRLYDFNRVYKDILKSRCELYYLRQLIDKNLDKLRNIDINNAMPKM